MRWRWKDENKVIEIGKGFCIAPPWFETDKIKISLVEGSSFGTGIHETTVSCMEIAEKIDFKGKRILDVGIGSGILSIAALKLGAKEAVGFDIEESAIRECIENGKLNGVSDGLVCFVADSPSSISGSFDVVFANIFDDIILAMCDEINRLTKDGGFVVLSGVLPEENFTVKKRFTQMGYQLLENRFLEEYTTLLFKKGD
ncbi:50S ribosomal protein L11 methyltransferase [Hippea maritima]|uniref:Methyltransferase type 11 n=1 Tax=Hippea maritima (strain ATCC 700847 / DSM 10411 / MH2) TaxID=760142 RepID=F2LVK2_HIPMA|nr:50S ribosomal protein L11 methyltransferase [Hippea maritima]AEA33786.1 Methyltransferase type 11 [Hippea maritima DSM 10411]